MKGLIVTYDYAWDIASGLHDELLKCKQSQESEWGGQLEYNSSGVSASGHNCI